MCCEFFSPDYHPWDRELRFRFGKLPHGLDDTHDLPGELAGWSEDKSLRSKHLIVDAGEDREDECGGLARSRLGLCDHVSRRVGKEIGERLLLDFRGPPEVHEVDPTDEVFRARGGEAGQWSF